MAPNKCFWLLHGQSKGVPVITIPLINWIPAHSQMLGLQWTVGADAEIKSVLCMPDPSRATLSITTTASSLSFSAVTQTQFWILYLTPFKLKPTPPSGQTFFHNLAGILIWSCCAFIMPSHLRCIFRGDWPDCCIIASSTVWASANCFLCRA